MSGLPSYAQPSPAPASTSTPLPSYAQASTPAPAAIPSENAPGNNALILGGVIFWTGECPEDLPIGGGSQMEETHTLTGGTRIVATFGPSADDITWTGKFFDQNIEPRVRLLRLYMTNALEVVCIFGAEQYLVIVKDFKPNYRGAYGTYNITLTVTEDQSGAFTIASPTSLDNQVAALVQQSKTANQAILTQQAANLASENPLIAAAANVSGPSLSAYQTAMNSLEYTIETAGPIAANFPIAGPAIVASAGIAIAGVTAFQDTLAPNDPSIVNTALLVASLTAISLNATRGQSVAQTIVQGSSTFAIAALQYGSIGQAYPLAQANGLPSPFLSVSAGITISLPPLASL